MADHRAGAGLFQADVRQKILHCLQIGPKEPYINSFSFLFWARIAFGRSFIRSVCLLPAATNRRPAKMGIIGQPPLFFKRSTPGQKGDGSGFDLDSSPYLFIHTYV
jgi:hypothetical protein